MAKAKNGAIAKSEAASNPLLADWSTPFALPPFSRIKPEHFTPAFEIALKEHLAEIRAIADADAEPTFENTILAMERAGQVLDRVASVFFNLSSADTSAALQAIERDMAPKLAMHRSRIFLNAKLFARIARLYERRKRLGLDDEQLRLLERIHIGFVRAGAELDPGARKRVAAIDKSLARLTTQFQQNVLADEQSYALVLDGEKDLAGLPQGLRAAAAETAASLGHKGKHVVTLARSSVEGFLQFSARRDLREEAFKAWISRGEKGGRTDNRGILARIAGLRAERARLLGYESYADYALADTMAKTPKAVRSLLGKVWQPAVARASEERKALQDLARTEGGNFEIEPWDWRYYAERVRKARFDLDDAEIRPYLQLDNMIAAAFDVAGKLFGLAFTELPEAPRYHKDVRVWEVKDRLGRHVGVFMGDYFARPSKRSGAWMSTYRDQMKLDRDQRPVVVNVMNFQRGAKGQPALLSFDDARTLFHEFGHGLHGLMSDVTYPTLAGTSVARDFVELPSQLYEHWLTVPQVLKRFARHVETGAPMPQKLVDRIKAARNFNQGFATVEYTACALVDMDLHELKRVDDLDVTRFEARALASIGMPREIVMRHRLPHFQHIVGGYAAGYYSYLWSEVMDADAFGAFEEAGDPFDAGVAAKLSAHVYSAGNRRDPAEAYKAFRGRMPDTRYLLKKRGFIA
jgi:peptidyl-dipeptidase Dcp